MDAHRREFIRRVLAASALVGVGGVAVALVPGIHLARTLAKRIAGRFASAPAPASAEEEASP